MTSSDVLVISIGKSPWFDSQLESAPGKAVGNSICRLAGRPRGLYFLAQSWAAAGWLSALGLP